MKHADIFDASLQLCQEEAFIYRMSRWIGSFFSSRRSCGTSEKSEGPWFMLGSLHRRSSWRLAVFFECVVCSFMEKNPFPTLLGTFWWLATSGQVAKTTGKLVPMSPEQLVECDVSWLIRWLMLSQYPMIKFLPNSGKFRQQLCWWKGCPGLSGGSNRCVEKRCGGGLSRQGADCGMFGGWPYLAYQFLQKAGGMFSEADWPYYKEGMFPCMPKGQGCFKRQVKTLLPLTWEDQPR